jgi:hypothetical protein
MSSNVQPQIRRLTSLDEALARAEQQSKPVLLDFACPRGTSTVPLPRAAAPGRGVAGRDRPE